MAKFIKVTVIAGSGQHVPRNFNVDYIVEYGEDLGANPHGMIAMADGTVLYTAEMEDIIRKRIDHA